MPKPDQAAEDLNPHHIARAQFESSLPYAEDLSDWRGMSGGVVSHRPAGGCFPTVPITSPPGARSWVEHLIPANQSQPVVLPAMLQ